jgi:hypothetical protein
MFSESDSDTDSDWMLDNSSADEHHDGFGTYLLVVTCIVVPWLLSVK